MLISDALRVYRGWRKTPPVHRLVAAFMGVKAASAPHNPAVIDEKNLDAFVADANEKLGRRRPGR